MPKSCSPVGGEPLWNSSARDCRVFLPGSRHCPTARSSEESVLQVSYTKDSILFKKAPWFPSDMYTKFTYIIHQTEHELKTL